MRAMTNRIVKAWKHPDGAHTHAFVHLNPRCHLSIDTIHINTSRVLYRYIYDVSLSIYLQIYVDICCCVYVLVRLRVRGSASLYYVRVYARGCNMSGI